MGIVSVAAIMIFGAIGIGVVVGIVILLSIALQSDSDRRREAKWRREHDQHRSP